MLSHACVPANESRPLIHSQYLHRESIYLADEQFARGAALRAHIVMEKIMASYSQVEPYISAVRGIGGVDELLQRGNQNFGAGDRGKGDGGGRIGPQQHHSESARRPAAAACAGGAGNGAGESLDPTGCGYRVVILATAADLERCKLSNKVRRRSGHVITQTQLEEQHRRYTATLADLVARMGAARAGAAPEFAAMGLVVIDTNSFLDETARGVPLAVAQQALAIQYARFLPP